MIIGLTGTLGAGKGSIVDFLVKKGFKHYSVREFLIEEIKKTGLEINLDNMVYIANKLRAENSPSYIVEKLYEKAKEDGGDCIIESLRAIGEIEALKNKGDFYLIAVDAEVRTRYERAILRKSESDDISFEKFVQVEQDQMESTDPNKQNLKACIGMADVKIINNGSLEELEKDVEEIIQKFVPRPNWDEYFVEISRAVAQRATCNRGRSGCVISKDKQILVTGYVGSPIGLPHCDEVGHQMKTTIHEDGKQTKHCVRTTHAEQNAICQAAKRGISIEGATLYCKMTPCSVCAKLIINSGIKKVVCEKKYHAGGESEELFKKAGVELKIIKDELVQYKNQ